MNFWLRLRYEFWPPIKVRTRYCWWIIKYGGKKKIPREVVFGAMTKSLKRMNDNLEKAYESSVYDPNSSATEVHQVLRAKRQASEFERSAKKLADRSKPGSQK
jgi:hypothetical protein